MIRLGTPPKGKGNIEARAKRWIKQLKIKFNIVDNSLVELMFIWTSGMGSHAEVVCMFDSENPAAAELANRIN